MDRVPDWPGGQVLAKGVDMSQTPTSIEQPALFSSRGQPSLRIEGIAHVPAGAQHAPVVILCHPQPASSDMRDPLTVLLARRLADAGMIALRFNFRGVGKSQGQQSDGRMEPLDLAGAIDYTLALPGADASKVCVVGHAFGAYIALVYAPYDLRIRTIVAVSLPMYRMAAGLPKAFERPKLFVTGEFDEICPLFKLEPFVEQLKGPKGIKVIVGARHLMRDYEEAALTTIMKYIKTWAEMPGV
jgi:alpha/beta superfamily hydrolase